MGAKFPQSCSDYSSAFAGAQFARSPDFQQTGLRWIAALDRAVLEHGPLLDLVAPAVVEQEFLGKTLPKALKIPKDYHEPEKQLESQLLALQGGVV